jgi:hypothetical protein
MDKPATAPWDSWPGGVTPEKVRNRVDSTTNDILKKLNCDGDPDTRDIGPLVKKSSDYWDSFYGEFKALDERLSIDPATLEQLKKQQSEIEELLRGGVLADDGISKLVAKINGATEAVDGLSGTNLGAPLKLALDFQPLIGNLLDGEAPSGPTFLAELNALIAELEKFSDLYMPGQEGYIGRVDLIAPITRMIEIYNMMPSTARTATESAMAKALPTPPEGGGPFGILVTPIQAFNRLRGEIDGGAATGTDLRPAILTALGALEVAIQTFKVITAICPLSIGFSVGAGASAGASVAAQADASADASVSVGLANMTGVYTLAASPFEVVKTVMSSFVSAYSSEIAGK